MWRKDKKSRITRPDKPVDKDTLLFKLLTAAREGDDGHLAWLICRVEGISEVLNSALPDGWTALHYVADLASDEDVSRSALPAETLIPTHSAVLASPTNSTIFSEVPVKSPTEMLGRSASAPRIDSLATAATRVSAPHPGPENNTLTPTTHNSTGVNTTTGHAASHPLMTASDTSAWAASPPPPPVARLAKLLIAAGCNPNVAERHGITPLMLACDGMKEVTVQLLLSAGAEPNAADRRGHTALHVAARRGCLPVVRALLAAGADPSVRSVGLGRTPLHAACAAGSAAVVRELLEHGAEVNAVDAVRRETPLHTSAMEGNIAVLLPLLQHGAAVAQKTTDGETAVQLAIKHGHRATAVALSKLHANLCRYPVVKLLRLLGTGRAVLAHVPVDEDPTDDAPCAPCTPFAGALKRMSELPLGAQNKILMFL